MIISTIYNYMYQSITDVADHDSHITLKYTDDKSETYSEIAKKELLD